MGYYVNTEDVNILIKKEDFDAVYKIMCELNDHDELKRGGSYGGNNDQQPGDRYSRNKWFSWMDWNYPETCSNLQEVLNQVGFEVSYNDNGDINRLSYSNKTGNEDYFLACLSGYTPDGSYIEFNGEESNDYFRYLYVDGKCIFQRANVIIDYDNPHYEEVFIPLQITQQDKIHNEWMENYRKQLAEKNNQTA